MGPEAPAERLGALGRQLPAVVIGRPLPPGNGDVDVVRAADDEGVAQAVNYLTGLDHRRITYVDGGQGPIAALRRRGYQHAMLRHQLGDQVQIIQGSTP